MVSPSRQPEDYHHSYLKVTKVQNDTIWAISKVNLR